MSLLKSIDDFFADRSVQGAIEATRETRPLQICYPSEIPVSRFLAWLFDPTQGHGLNGAMLRRLLLAIWETKETDVLGRALANKISPTLLSTHSFADVVIDREVAFNNARLDVLVLIPSLKLVLAIENKFGAKERATQLERYKKGLEDRFRDWHHILVFLDSNGMQPKTPGWIGLDYEWLIEELKIAELSDWLGDEPRKSIRHFRHAIDRQEGGLPGIDEQELLEMVLRHPDVFGVLAEWARSRQPPATLAERIINGKTSQGIQRLLAVYCHRTALWRQCILMLGCAEFRAAAGQAFGEDLDWDPKRSAFYFTLKTWDRFRDEDAKHWPLQVMVREQFDVGDKERFVVVSQIYRPFLNIAHSQPVISIAEAYRRLSMNRKLPAGFKQASLRVDYCETQNEAAKLLCEHLVALKRKFDPLLK